MEFDMKTEEDEAFDDLARKQGDWGGGFQAKRQMAADKLQEPVAWITPDGEGFRIRFSAPTNDVPLGWDALYTTPPKLPWVGLTPEETSGFTQHEMTVAKYVSKVLQEKNT
jgi:hypothetical protein